MAAVLVQYNMNSTDIMISTRHNLHKVVEGEERECHVGKEKKSKLKQSIGSVLNPTKFVVRFIRLLPRFTLLHF